MTDRFWTEEKVEQLKQMVADGLNSTAISNRLGCSRNAVIGKMLRMGIKSRHSPSLHHSLRQRPKVRPQAKASPKRTTPFRSPSVPLPPPVAASLDIPVAQRCTIWQLTAVTCRWPYGTPGEPNFYFCGAQPLGGSPYCGHHSRRAWVRR